MWRKVTCHTFPTPQQHIPAILYLRVPPAQCLIVPTYLYNISRVNGDNGNSKHNHPSLQIGVLYMCYTLLCMCVLHISALPSPCKKPPYKNLPIQKPTSCVFSRLASRCRCAARTKGSVTAARTRRTCTSNACASDCGCVDSLSMSGLLLLVLLLVAWQQVVVWRRRCHGVVGGVHLGIVQRCNDVINSIAVMWVEVGAKCWCELGNGLLRNNVWKVYHHRSCFSLNLIAWSWQQSRQLWYIPLQPAARPHDQHQHTTTLTRPHEAVCTLAYRGTTIAMEPRQCALGREMYRSLEHGHPHGMHHLVLLFAPRPSFSPNQARPHTARPAHDTCLSRHGRWLS